MSEQMGGTFQFFIFLFICKSSIKKFNKLIKKFVLIKKYLNICIIK